MPNRKTNRHGDHQEVHIRPWKRDRIGICSGTVERHLFEDFDTLDFAALTVRAAPVMGGVPCVNVLRTYDEAQGMAVYLYSYEGANSDYEFDETEVTYELDVAMSEDAIQTHPLFTSLLKVKYGWTTSKAQFPEFKPAEAPASGLSGPDATKQTKSELYGTDSYLAIGGHYRVSYARRAVPPEAVARANQIVEAPRGIGLFNLPGWARKRNWLCLGPRVVHRGNVVQVSEEYLLSGPNGWNKDVYGKLGAEGSGDGLTTGTLNSGSL